MIRRFVFWVGVSLIINMVVGLAGFTLATDQMARQSALEKTDAIVVLTGGSGERIRHAAQLLKNEYGERLLISGVNHQVKDQEVRKVSELSMIEFYSAVDIDRSAENTIGNARQIEVWAKKNKYKSLLVVTSTYHMPRAMIELQTQMPDMKLHPAPAASIGAARQHMVRRTLVEYGKFLVILPLRRPITAEVK